MILQVVLVSALLGVSAAFLQPPSRIGLGQQSRTRFILMSTTDTPASQHYTLKNDLMVRAAKGEQVERTPVWLFRQAGRHLPEYNAYKKDTNKNFLELLQSPADVAEVTMQPVRRYNVDAAILFSDILVVPEALGIDVEMPGGVGITVPRPLKGTDDLARFESLGLDGESKETVAKELVYDKLSHVLEAVKAIKTELKGQVPLIGFSAAPWTLMYYMVGGSSKKNQEVAQEQWLNSNPEESRRLLDLLTTVVIEYMSAQVENGCEMLQVFEAMGSFIAPESFQEFALPAMTRIARTLKDRHPNVPIMVFPRGATYSLVDLQEAGYDVVTLDTETDRIQTRASLQAAATAAGRLAPAGVQGNFSPKDLIATPDGDIEADKAKVRSLVQEMLQQLGPQKLVANLGEGLMGKEDPVLVNEFVEAIH
eukprot:CAMPEP_0113935246 /NCGR_PEP_ID=MMETSP1339-20121228/2426_1 /TAXON_ID=94617 /ORGANISM="Fibrocapsa japonica" /LENGTH=422 /DNA_ID=CAMNT_0000937319 /DNA_START=42 /DNA_END=1307 /DNA_ORIENTATION=+ /assembly_acc=CAM_ASM_000762